MPSFAMPSVNTPLSENSNSKFVELKFIIYLVLLSYFIIYHMQSEKRYNDSLSVTVTSMHYCVGVGSWNG